MKKAKHPLSKKNRRDITFYVIFIALPVLQFCIFYIFVNFRSFLYAFQSYQGAEGVFVGFQNFIDLFNEIKETPIFFGNMLRNSLIALACELFIGMPLGLIFSYYIYKKRLLSGLFRSILFLPTIISAAALAILFKYFMDRFLPEFIRLVSGNDFSAAFLTDEQYQFGSIIFYAIFIGFGTSSILYTNAMSNVPISIIEAAQIDGANPFVEFIKIILPMIFPTVSVFIITKVAALFSNQMQQFPLFGTQNLLAPNNYVFGFWLYKSTILASASSHFLNDLPRLATFGLIFSIISIPITFLIRFGLNRIEKRFR
ncbi:MAG: carbohydrate ABC transporter permease [Bacilli bacterium]